VHLKQLEAFTWVVRLGSFALAARHLATTQPTISARIRELEHWMGAELFDRSGRRAELTAKGRQLLDNAERILTLAAETRAAVGDAAGLRGVVRLGAIDNIALTWLPELMRQIGRAHPGIVIELFVDLSMHLRDRLLTHDLDLAFLVGPVPGPRIVTLPLGGARVAMMASPRFKLSRGVKTPRDLAGYPFISHSRGSHLYVQMQNWFQQGGVAPPVFHGCSSVAMMIRLMTEGVGMGVMPPPLVQQELRAGLLRPVEIDPPLEGFDYIAAYSTVDLQPATRIIARLAAEIAARSPLSGRDAPPSAAGRGTAAARSRARART